MKKLINEKPQAILYAVGVFLPFLAAFVSMACASTLSVISSAPTQTPTTTPPTATGEAQAPALWEVCQSGGLNVRTGAGTQYGVIGSSLPDGEQVAIISASTVTTPDGAQWVEIASTIADAIVGWVNVRYLCEDK